MKEKTKEVLKFLLICLFIVGLVLAVDKSLSDTFKDGKDKKLERKELGILHKQVESKP